MWSRDQIQVVRLGIEYVSLPTEPPPSTTFLVHCSDTPQPGRSVGAIKNSHEILAGNQHLKWLLEVVTC